MMEMTEAHESLSATQDFCSPPPRASKSFLQELDEAAAKLDSALKEVSFQEEHSISVSRDVSQLWEEADDDDLSDEIYNLKFSTGTLQQELDRYSFDQPHPNEDMDFRNTNADHRPDVIFEEEEPLFLSQDDDKEEGSRAAWILFLVAILLIVIVSICMCCFGWCCCECCNCSCCPGV